MLVLVLVLVLDWKTHRSVSDVYLLDRHLNRDPVRTDPSLTKTFEHEDEHEQEHERICVICGLLEDLQFT